MHTSPYFWDDHSIYTRLPLDAKVEPTRIGPFITPYRAPHVLTDPKYRRTQGAPTRRFYSGEVSLNNGTYFFTWIIEMGVKQAGEKALDDIIDIERVKKIQANRVPLPHYTEERRRALLQMYLDRKPIYDRVPGMYGDFPETKKLWNAFLDVVLTHSFFLLG